MSALVKNLILYAPNYRQAASVFPYYFSYGLSPGFAFGQNLRRGVAIFSIILLAGGVGLYVFSVQASFLEAGRLELFEKRISEESKAVAEISATATELSSPQFLRPAAENQAMIAVSKMNFIRQDSSVALQTRWQP